MRIAGMKFSTVDGPGLRFVVLLQGCEHKCPGCYDPTAPQSGGVDFPFEELVDQMLANPDTEGLTISGGEPFAQAEDCLALIREARKSGFNIWCHTGASFEILRDHGTAVQKELLAEIDVLADIPAGSAEEAAPPLACGISRDKRFVRVKESLESGSTVLWEA